MKSFRVIFISFFIYVVLNLVENILHYNIGKHRGANKIQVEFPDLEDYPRIIFVMVFFASIQGILTFVCL